MAHLSTIEYMRVTFLPIRKLVIRNTNQHRAQNCITAWMLYTRSPALEKRNDYYMQMSILHLYHILRQRMLMKTQDENRNVTGVIKSRE